MTKRVGKFWFCCAYVVFALVVIAAVSAVIVFANDPGFGGVWQLLFVPVTWFAWEMPGASDLDGSGNLAVAQAWTILFVLVSVAIVYVLPALLVRAARTREASDVS